MPPPHLRVILAAATFGVVAGPAAHAATYEPADYVLIPFGAPDPDDLRVIMFGINNLGQAVGLRLETTSSRFESLIWLPWAAYSEDAGIHSLDACTGFTNGGGQENEGTIAFDINDAGVAVGRHHTSSLNDAVIWDLADGSADASLAGKYNAFSINNDNPAQVVGGLGSYYEYTFGGGLPQAQYTTSFIHEVDGSTSTLPTGSLNAVAFGISDTASSISNVRIAGLKSCDLGIDCGFGSCDDYSDGGYWDDPTSTVLELKEDAAGATEPTEFIVGHAVNDDNVPLIAGFGHDPADTTSCRQFGYVWRNGPSSSPDRLPLLINEPEQSELALDIRDTLGDGTIEVVGRNVTLRRGLLWRYTSGSGWSTIDISGDTADVIDHLRGFDFLECATAINDDGWIVVWGPLDTQSAPYRSGVLIPYDEYRTNICPGDIAGPDSLHPDGVVDVFDLLTILANYNTDREGRDIASPTNIVDVFDLLEVLANWQCAIGAHDPVSSLEDEVTGAGLTMNDWDDFEDLMLDGQTPVKVKENWSCWMKNYLSGCTTCPPCPDADPFD